MATEIYKDIKGYEGLYQISNFGNVKSLPKTVFRKTVGNFQKKENILTPYISTTGYCCVKLRSNLIDSHFKIHRLIAIAFISNPDDLPEVNHINKIKTDNRIENLEWVSCRENSCHNASKMAKSSIYIGVSFCKQTNKWKSQIVFNKKRITIGRFMTENEAHQKRLNFEKQNGIVNKYA